MTHTTPLSVPADAPRLEILKDAGMLTLRLAGAWRKDIPFPDPRPVRDALAATPPPATLRFDAAGVTA